MHVYQDKNMCTVKGQLNFTDKNFVSVNKEDINDSKVLYERMQDTRRNNNIV